MKLTRRKFLETGTCALTISAGLLLMPTQNTKGHSNKNTEIPTLDSLEKTPENFFDSISNLSKIAFANQIGTQFNISSESHDLAGITLAAVQDLPKRKNEQKKRATDGFSLLFKVKKGQPIIQDTYLINHQTLGSFRLLLVPVLYSTNNPVFCYEAVINHLS